MAEPCARCPIPRGTSCPGLVNPGTCIHPAFESAAYRGSLVRLAAARRPLARAEKPRVPLGTRHAPKPGGG
jgi:hypothetical protein